MCAVCVCVVSIKDNYYYTCNATINGIINASAHAQLRTTFSGLHNFRKDEQNINRKSDRETDRATTSPGCGIIFDSGSISIALSLSLSQSTLRHAKPKQNTLCRPFAAPSSAFSVCWECSVGFSLRLFNSSHIFFIDFSTPAFLWSTIRSSL